MLFGGGSNIFEFGDACDPDLEGDNRPDPGGGGGGGESWRASAALAAEVDARPYDTDNDGTDNVTDPDDDNDGVADAVDNCRLHTNADQANLDADGFGNVCDMDMGGDLVLDALELALGSRIDDHGSQPEVVGR